MNREVRVPPNRWPALISLALGALLLATGCALPRAVREQWKVKPIAPVVDRAERSVGALRTAVREAARAEHLQLETVARWRTPETGQRGAVAGSGMSSDAARPAAVAGNDKGPASPTDGQASPPVDLLRVIPFEVTPEIRAFALRNTHNATSSYQQVAALLNAIYHVSELREQYEPGLTRTAAETLASGRGNCFAFTNLFVAAARSLGIPTYYLDASPGHSQVRLENGHVLHSRHIVAGVITSIGNLTIDFNQVRKVSDDFWFRRLSDYEVTALYLNNLGYDAMRNGVDAIPYFRTAIRLAPQLDSPWNNLATLLMSSGHEQDAMQLLLQTVSGRPSSFAPYFNLGLLYMREGQYSLAEDSFRSAWWRRRDNPYLLYQLGVTYLRQGKTVRAKWALRQALWLDRSFSNAQTKLDLISRR